MQSQTRTYFDEMNTGPAGVRDLYANYANWLRDVPPEQLESKRQEAELLFRRGHFKHPRDKLFALVANIGTGVVLGGKHQNDRDASTWKLMNQAGE